MSYTSYEALCGSYKIELDFIFIIGSLSYTGYAGWYVTASIPVKFGTAHDGSRPEVGSTKRIDVYGRKGVTLAPRKFRYLTSDK